MRILHVIGSLAPRYGGPSKACLDMARAVAALGHRVDVFTTDLDGDRRMDVPLGTPIVQGGVPVHYFSSNVLKPWPLSLDLARALARSVGQYDLVHIHSLYRFHSAAAAYQCRRQNVPYVLRPHGTLDPFIYARRRFRKAIYEWLIERHNLRGAAAIHFTALDERQLACRFIGDLPSFIIPLGLHLPEYSDLPPSGIFRTAYPEIGDRRVILHLGRITEKKGLDILVAAFARIQRSHEDLHLVLAGPDNDGYGLVVRRHVEALGLGARVTFTGMLQGRLKLAALKDANVFALPSYTENFGIAVLEALACGLPVVISNNVNIWREIDDNGAGLVTSCDPDQLAAALSRVLTDASLANAMRIKGRKVVRERFDWGTVGFLLAAAYEGVIGQRPVADPSSPTRR